MKRRNHLVLLMFAAFFFTSLTLVAINNNPMQVINNENGTIHTSAIWSTDTNEPADITTTTAGTETIDWILYLIAGGTGNLSWVEKDGSSYGTPQSWSANETTVQIPINRTVTGVFEYKITCNNTADDKASDIVIVTVVVVPPPTFGPLEIVLIAGVSIGAIGGIEALAFIGRRR